VINLLSPKARLDPEAVERVKAWVPEALQLPEEAVVTVMELRCAEDDCPDVETVIAVFGEPGASRKHKLLKPLSEVTKSDVMNLTVPKQELRPCFTSSLRSPCRSPRGRQPRR